MKLRKWIAVMAAVLMVVSMMPLSVFAALGGDFPWTDTSEKMLIEEILERDGLIDGVWFPWMDGGRCGHNLTGNELMAKYYNSPQNTAKFIDWNCVEMDRLGADTIYRQIYNLKAMGYNVMAYAGSIYAEGVIFDEYGDVLGIKEEYLTNARRLLDMCREIGMPVMWNVYFHSSTTASYYGIDGWNVMCQMLGNNEIADHYAERFVRPLCEMLAEYPDVVALVSIADEPENEINDDGVGNHYAGDRAVYGVNQDDMIYFMQQINEVVREELPNVARTVASNSGNKTIYRDFDLDLMGHNQYTDGDTFVSVESLITDADPILTEYNIGGNTFYEDDEYAEKLITFREWMMDNGYKGGFQWCWLPDGAAVTTKGGSAYYLLRDGKDSTSFRKTVSLLRYYIDEYRAEHRGETITVDAPVLYANAGDGKVLFIPSKRATTITIQRSEDGGNTWTNVLEDAIQSKYVDEHLIGTYVDETAPDSGYCYRIIAKDANGNTVTSEPNNVAGAEDQYVREYIAPTYKLGDYYQKPTKTKAQAKLNAFGVELNRPVASDFNLIENGSFESEDGQWNVSSFLQYAQVVADSTTPSGTKSLFFDTSAQSEADWYTFTVTGLNPNTDYTFSAFLKGAYLAADNKGMASIGVMDPDTGDFMVYWEYYKDHQRASRDTQQLYPTAWDDEWHLRSVSFNSGELTEVTIALYGYSSKLWVDDMALFESSNGRKYNNGQSSKAITTNAYAPADGATNAITDPDVNNASYWNTGAGYKQGFMSIGGGALQYTASSDPNGVRYTKWFDVKPGTDYYYSFTVTVTQPGDGRVAILDNAKLLPNEVVTAAFSTTGQKTYTGRISTGMYDRLGLCVVDLGGVATIDDICFYEGEASGTIPTEPSYDGYIINGNFEIGSSANWENLWNNNTVEIVAGRDSAFAMKGTAGGTYTQVRQKITVEPDTDYVIEVWAKGVNGTTLIVKDSNDSNLKQTALQGSGSTWTKTTLEFNSGDNLFIHLGLMGNMVGATWTVDDVKMRKKSTAAFDGYLYNGDFETGTAHPWENLWGSNTVTIVEGHNSAYGMQVNAGEYTVVRQQVTVEKNTDYVITLWSRNSIGGSLLVKDSADSNNIVNQSLNTSSSWAKTEVEFNSGSNTVVYVGFMGGYNGSSYEVDDVAMAKKQEAEPDPAFGLINGAFEEGKDGWIFGSGQSAIVSDAHSGNYAIQLTNPGAWSSAAEQTIPVNPDTNYTITWWYKATPGTGTFNLAVMNANGYANLTKVNGANFMNNYTGGWQQGSYTVNTDSATEMIIKWTTEATNPGTILIDDIEVNESVCAHWYIETTEQGQTCGQDGIYRYTCDYCRDSYTVTLPATGDHTYSNCEDYDCDVCYEYRNAPGHNMYSYTTSSPTCGDSGTKLYECNNCGYSRHETLPATGKHSYSYSCDPECDVCYQEREVTEHEYWVNYREEPSCGYDGYIYYVCDDCGAEYTDTLPATGAHEYAYDCSEYCAVCDEYRDNAAEHAYQIGDSKEPTCGENGYTQYICSECGSGYTEDLSATGDHEYAYDCSEHCAACGGENPHAIPHILNAYACEGGDCEVCGTYLFPEPHEYAAACDATCNVCGYQRGVNVLVNGSFEDGEDGWTFGSGTHDFVEDAYEGRYALQLTNPGMWASGAEQTIPVTPNTWYTITWWSKADKGTGTFNLCLMNANGYANLNIKNGENWMNNHTGQWRPHSLEVYTATATAIILKWSTEADNPGTILLDNLTISTEQLADHAYDYACSTVCSACGETTRPDADHTHDNEYDSACNGCGAIREVEMPLVFAGNSVSEDVKGLAFRFDLVNIAMRTEEDNRYKAIYDDDTTLDGHKLVKMGAIVTNRSLDSLGKVPAIEDVDGQRIIDINAEKVLEINAEEAMAAFAVRIIHIPVDTNGDTAITAIPYFVVVIDGVETYVYGEAQTNSYNAANNKNQEN